ncbi:MAG: hypothetical protein KBD65_02855 [Candidatus Moranbacteria bacterium]|nr:hypothetical protein [Candidatus Moranbacteria bacterium]
MGAHEVYLFEKGTVNPLETDGEREKFKEQMLQLSWFQHRCEALYDDEHTNAILERIIQESPEQEQRIKKAGRDERMEIIVEDMINSPMGNAEAAWFRQHFPNDKSAPLSPEYKVLLDTFDADPAFVFAELDKLFSESVTTH